ncbi:MAG: hypothetical protein IPM94_11375 [bacterium]|nr:hypothetical protein [bacterium]
MMIEVFAFRGDLDFDKFAAFDTLLYGGSISQSIPKSYVLEYGREVERSEYIRNDSKGVRIYTTMDLLMQRARNDYAYAVVSNSFNRDDANIVMVRTHLHLYPPRRSVLGIVMGAIGDVIDHVPTILSWISWIIAMGLGWLYVMEKLKGKWRGAIYALIGAMVLAVACARLVFNAGWILTLLMPVAVLAIVGIAAALLGGTSRSRLEVDLTLVPTQNPIRIQWRH